MAFTEFCCRSGGSNLNAGTLTGNGTIPGTSPSFTYAGTFSTNTFTVSAGNPLTDGVAAGQFVHCNNGAALGRIARITSVTSTTIVLSTAATVGSGTGATVANVGGAWQGPNGANPHPFNSSAMSNALTNAAGDTPRVNLKNDQTYTISAGLGGITRMRYQGFTTAYGDDGKAVISGPTTGASFSLVSTAASALWFVDLIFEKNGDSGSAVGLSMTGSGGTYDRCVFRHFFRSGVSVSSGVHTFRECEFFDCNQNNANTGHGGLQVTTATVRMIRCISHSNTGNATYGIYISNPVDVDICQTIVANNGLDGIYIIGNASTQRVDLDHCTIDANDRDGIRIDNSAVLPLTIENSLFTRNAGYGINGTVTSSRVGDVINCAFGTGTWGNSSGQHTGLTGMDERGTITLASNTTPYQDADNGDFRLVLSTVKNTGRGSFLQTASSWSGTVSYPDVGAVQHQDSGGGGMAVSQGLHGIESGITA